MPLVYEELCKLAPERLAREAPGQTLQATALAGVPTRFCAKCPHCEPFPTLLSATRANAATLAGRRWNGFRVEMHRDGSTWRGQREDVAVMLTRDENTWHIEVMLEGARLSVGKLAFLSAQPLVLHWRAVSRNDKAIYVFVTT